MQTSSTALHLRYGTNRPGTAFDRRAMRSNDIYVQAGVGPAGGRMHVVINAVRCRSMTREALRRRVVTIDEIAENARQREMSR